MSTIAARLDRKRPRNNVLRNIIRITSSARTSIVSQSTKSASVTLVPCHHYLHSLLIDSQLQVFKIYAHSVKQFSTSLRNYDDIEGRETKSLSESSNLLMLQQQQQQQDILKLLQDSIAGSLTQTQINIAEKTLQSYTTGRRQSPSDFDNAKYILSRLLLEEEYYKKQKHNVVMDIQNKERNNSKHSNFVRRIMKVAGGDETVDGNNYTDFDDDDDDDEGCYLVRPFLLNRVLDCWRKGWRNGNINIPPTEIIAWIDELDMSHGIITDSRSLTLIIDGICLRGDPAEAPLLAQWLLDRRIEQASDYDESGEEGDKEENQDVDVSILRPDTILFTNVIRAWARSSRIEAPDMAEGLLQLMLDSYHRGWKDSGPNTVSYGITMEAWYKSQHPEAAHRIEDLLNKMKDSDIKSVVPDRICYQYLINALAKSRSADAADKAYKVLQEMIALHEAGNDLVTPHVSNFSQVMAVLARQGDLARTEAVLEQLQDLYLKSGDPHFQPNEDCWKACILVKAKKGLASEAQGMLDEMIERASSSGKRSLMPPRSYFVDVLVSWTKHRNKMVAAQQSQKVLDRMSELGKNPQHRNLLPDSISYNKVILAWSRTRHPSAPERIKKLLAEMEYQSSLGYDRMHPNLSGYTNLMLAWQRSGNPGSAEEVQLIFESLRDRYTNGEQMLCPDKYVYGIVMNSWLQCNKFNHAEKLFEEMINEWRNTGKNVQPDIHIFHNILKSCSNKMQNNAVEKCRYYISLMEELGLPITVLAQGFLINALSNSSLPDRAGLSNDVLQQLFQSIENGKTALPPHKEYLEFLRAIATSDIPQRREQAQQLLETLPKGHVPKELLPPLQ